MADDWPIDYWTLEPYFAENDRMMGVAGLAGDPAYPPHQPTLPPVPLGRTGARYAQALNKLGWHWWPSDIAVATTEYDGRAKCINLGQCTLGCAQGAKASVDITYWPHALRDRVELRTRCRVREITTNEQGMASGVVYYDAERGGAVPAGRSGDPGGQRRRHAAAAAELGLRRGFPMAWRTPPASSART